MHIRVTCISHSSSRWFALYAATSADINESSASSESPRTPFVAAKLPPPTPLLVDMARGCFNPQPSFTASHGNSSTQLIPNGGAREQDNARPPSSNVAASRAKPTPFAISVPTGCFFNRIPSYFPLQFEPSKLSRDSRSIPRISPWSLAAPPRLEEYVGFVDLPCQLRSSCNTQFSCDVKSISYR